jgi:hypothetical protein
MRPVALQIAWVVVGSYADSRQEARLGALLDIAKEYVEAVVTSRGWLAEAEALDRLIQDRCPSADR